MSSFVLPPLPRLSPILSAMSPFVLPPPHTLARIRSLPYSAQIPALEANPDLYLREGFGAVYLCGRIDNVTRDEYRAGRITREDFLDRLFVKVGHAKDLHARQCAYEKCDDGQTHFWLLCFHPDRRILSERLCHLCFLADGAPRAIEECRGCHRHHREYWRYRDVGPFPRIEQRMQDVFTLLGQPGLSRQDLEDIEIAFPLP